MLACLAATTGAITRQYEVPLGESQWIVNRSRLECRLHQLISGYGSAEFRQTGTTQPEFKLTSWAGIPRNTAIKVMASPPSWRWREQPKLLFQQTLPQPVFPLATATRANLIAAELERGNYVGFRYAASKSEEVRVRISPENFSSQYHEYTECLGFLLPYKFKEVAKSTLYFAQDSRVLSEEVKLRLLQIRDYSLADKQVKQVKIEGYSDSLGRNGYNVFLSEQRAKAVRAFLIEKGLSDKMIKINWHGEANPLAQNDTEQGRALNRRVVVEIFN